jgi:hypothetical protein
VGEQAGGVLAGDVTGADDGGAKFGHGIGRRRDGEKERRRDGETERGRRQECRRSGGLSEHGRDAHATFSEGQKNWPSVRTANLGRKRGRRSRLRTGRWPRRGS